MGDNKSFPQCHPVCIEKLRSLYLPATSLTKIYKGHFIFARIILSLLLYYGLINEIKYRIDRIKIFSVLFAVFQNHFSPRDFRKKTMCTDIPIQMFKDYS